MSRKDPNKPKGVTSAYAFFVKSERLKAKEMGEGIVFGEFSKQCSAKWQDMEDDEKAPFENQADKDRERYRREMKVYQDNDESGGDGRRKKKKKKDPNAPKRAMSAFMHFCKHRRPVLKRSHPNSSVGDLAKLLGAEWKVMSNDAKAPFEKDAQEDKERYDEDMTSYRNGTFKPRGAKDDDYDDDSD